MQHYLRLAVEHPLATERAAAGHADTSLSSVFALAGLLVAGALAVRATGGTFRATGSTWACSRAGAGRGDRAVLAGARLGQQPIYDMRLVQEKVSRIAFRGELRLAVFAPGAPAAEVSAHLDRLAAAYRQYNLAAGNGLVVRPLRHARARPARLALLPPARAASVLTTRELAGLWHLPQARADVPLLERTDRPAVPAAAVHGRARAAGSASPAHQGRRCRWRCPTTCCAATCCWSPRPAGASPRSCCGSPATSWRRAARATRPALVLVDPHRDLAEAALGLVPPARRGDVVYLDVGRARRGRSA